MCEEASIRLSWICLLRSTSQSKPYGNHSMHAAHQFNGQPLTNSSIYSEDFMRLDEREKQKIKHSNYVYWRMGREARTINITFCIKIEPSNESNKQIRSMGASWNFVPMTHGLDVHLLSGSRIIQRKHSVEIGRRRRQRRRRNIVYLFKIIQNVHFNRIFDFSVQFIVSGGMNEFSVRLDK